MKEWSAGVFWCTSVLWVCVSDSLLQPQRSSHTLQSPQGSLPASLYNTMMISQPGQANVVQISTSLAQNSSSGTAVATFSQDRQLRYRGIRIDISVGFLHYPESPASFYVKRAMQQCFYPFSPCRSLYTHCSKRSGSKAPTPTVSCSDVSSSPQISTRFCWKHLV